MEPNPLIIVSASIGCLVLIFIVVCYIRHLCIVGCNIPFFAQTDYLGRPFKSKNDQINEFDPDEAAIGNKYHPILTADEARRSSARPSTLRHLLTPEQQKELEKSCEDVSSESNEQLNQGSNNNLFTENEDSSEIDDEGGNNSSKTTLSVKSSRMLLEVPTQIYLTIPTIFSRQKSKSMRENSKYSRRKSVNLSRAMSLEMKGDEHESRSIATCRECPLCSELRGNSDERLRSSAMHKNRRNSKSLTIIINDHEEHSKQGQRRKSRFSAEAINRSSKQSLRDLQQTENKNSSSYIKKESRSQSRSRSNSRRRLSRSYRVSSSSSSDEDYRYKAKLRPSGSAECSPKTTPSAKRRSVRSRSRHGSTAEKLNRMRINSFEKHNDCIRSSRNNSYEFEIKDESCKIKLSNEKTRLKFSDDVSASGINKYRSNSNCEEKKLTLEPQNEHRRTKSMRVSSSSQHQRPRSSSRTSACNSRRSSREVSGKDYLAIPMDQPPVRRNSRGEVRRVKSTEQYFETPNQSKHIRTGSVRATRHYPEPVEPSEPNRRLSSFEDFYNYSLRLAGHDVVVPSLE